MTVSIETKNFAAKSQSTFKSAYVKVARERERERERSSQQDKRIGKLKRVSYADWAVMHRLLIGSMDKVDGHDALQGGSQQKDLPFEKPSYGRT